MKRSDLYYGTRAVVRFLAGLLATTAICYLILWASAPI